jgi:hypothetical protein
MGYTQPLNPRQDLTYAEKIRFLREQKGRLMDMGNAEKFILEVESATLEAKFRCMFSKGTLVVPRGLKGLDVYRLASLNSGTKAESWSFQNLGAEITTVDLDIDLDLLVLIERPPSLVDTLLLHMRSLRSGKGHPMAAHNIIPHHVEGIGSLEHEVILRINGDVLTTEIRWSSSSILLAAWDWISGNQLLVSTLL